MILLQQDERCKRLHLAVIAFVAITLLLATKVESFNAISSRSSSRPTTNNHHFHSSPLTTKTTITASNPTTSVHSSSGTRRSALYMAGGVDKGFNLLEIATKVVPQGRIVQTTKESWKFIWKVRSRRKMNVVIQTQALHSCENARPRSISLSLKNSWISSGYFCVV